MQEEARRSLASVVQACFDHGGSIVACSRKGSCLLNRKLVLGTSGLSQGELQNDVMHLWLGETILRVCGLNNPSQAVSELCRGMELLNTKNALAKQVGVLKSSRLLADSRVLTHEGT